jgi:hypothetical protein
MALTNAPFVTRLIHLKGVLVDMSDKHTIFRMVQKSNLKSIINAPFVTKILHIKVVLTDMPEEYTIFRMAQLSMKKNTPAAYATNL